jgi:hypothetical protein
LLRELQPLLLQPERSSDLRLDLFSRLRGFLKLTLQFAEVFLLGEALGLDLMV